MKEFDRLVEIVKKLRSPQGCAWDRKQNIDSIKPYVIEEAYEVVSAIMDNDKDEICEELGDLLTQIVFIAQIADENNDFDIKDVCNAICDKLIRRHPHVFGDLKTEDTDIILKNWEIIKSKEKSHKRKSILDDIPKSLPSLLRAFKIQKRLSRVGFDWKNKEGAIEKVYEEFSELVKSTDRKNHKEIEEEFGDLIFSIINVARFFNIDLEIALTRTIDKVSERFRKIEEIVYQMGKEIHNLTLAEMDNLWNEIKKNEKIK